jgi:chlorite dismutase
MSDRNFVKLTYIKLDPAWRRRDSAERAQDKAEFAAACNDFAEDHFLRTYSLVGTRGDCDLMVRTIAADLDPIHEFHVLLNQTGLMRYADIAYSYGLDDQEFVVSFNADRPSEFLDLVHELRGTESSAYTESETPIFTCISASVERALGALDGEAISVQPAS